MPITKDHQLLGDFVHPQAPLPHLGTSSTVSCTVFEILPLVYERGAYVNFFEVPQCGPSRSPLEDGGIL